MLFWAAVIVESYTSYGLSRADPFCRLHARTRLPIQRRCMLWSEPRHATETIRRVLGRPGLRPGNILQVKDAEGPFETLV
jgi:hypothetical protein